MHYFKLLGSKTGHKELWENREALEKYLARLGEFWDEEKQRWKTDAEIEAEKSLNVDNPKHSEK